jgi:hypothetical protein
VATVVAVRTMHRRLSRSTVTAVPGGYQAAPFAIQCNAAATEPPEAMAPGSSMT